jgi:hypothetical protein
MGSLPVNSDGIISKRYTFNFNRKDATAIITGINPSILQGKRGAR